MERFASIERQAAKCVGGAAALAAQLPKPRSARALARDSDARCLAAMAKAIFSAGFQPQIVEHMWPGIKDAFWGFDPARVARIRGPRLAALVRNPAVVRHEGKLAAVVAGARFIVTAGAEHGGFSKLVARWPTSNIVGLWDLLRTGARWLGGSTASMMLRDLGKDTFVLGRAACDALIQQGVVARAPRSKRDLTTTQAAFNTWAEQSGRPLCQLSKILALTAA